MTYISAFHCQNGIVLCADSQETVDDQKRDAEKLYTAKGYPLALGGAGLGEAIDALAQELISRVERDLPLTVPELKVIIESSLKENHEKDAANSEWPNEYRKAQYLIAARPNHDKFVLFRVKGKRIYQVKQRVIIGYATAANEALLKRMYRPQLPIQQAVMLGIYLLSQSKALDAYVSGDTSIAIVNSDVAWMEYPDYIAAAEKRVIEFLKLIDNLFLLSIDGSIPPSKFPEVIAAFGEDVTRLRERYINEAAATSLAHTFHDPEYCGEPYNKIFLGAVINLKGDGTISVRQDTPGEIEERNKMFAALKEDSNQIENAKFIGMLQDRQVLFLGEETVQVRGTGGSVSESDKS